MKLNNFEINMRSRNHIEKCFYVCKDYTRAYKLTKNLINKINNQFKTIEKEELDYDYYFCYMILARICNHNKLYEEAIKNIYKAMEYPVKDYYNISAKWLLACIYKTNDQIDKAKIEYRDCYKYYRSIEEEKYMFGVKLRLSRLNQLNKKEWLISYTRIPL
ncbi:hypothetical protein [Clostridium tagluense]|uniref:Uncharacterized protein n=1 Tax=Clostridium tagluense TaxID=360422 RepID=A0A401UTJ8_9CLOT|nr:hypothetical protein [Clostridium tagluense]GCD12875.1 hypothetical protein Ctaglu_44980 [Clostridium tagluense]